MINELFAKYCETQDQKIDSKAGEEKNENGLTQIAGTGMAEIIDPTNTEI